MGDLAAVEETFKRIQSHKGVIGVVIINSDGIPMTATGGFELEGVFLGATGQTLTWSWTAMDQNHDTVATEQGYWTAGDDPLFMDPDGSGDYTGWKTLEFRFDWSLGAGTALSISATRLVAVPGPSIPDPSAVFLLSSACLLGFARFRRKFKS